MKQKLSQVNPDILKMQNQTKSSTTAIEPADDYMHKLMQITQICESLMGPYTTWEETTQKALLELENAIVRVQRPLTQESDTTITM